MAAETAPPTACPPTSDLERLVRGRLTEARAAALAEHVGGCSTCQRKLDALAGGTDDIPANLRECTKDTPPTDSAYYKALAAAEEEVRATAVLHIGYSRVYGFEGELTRALLEDSDARVREYAAAALRRTNAGVKALRSALSDNSVDVRFMALTALISCSETVERSTQQRIEDDADRHVVYALSIFHDR